MLTTNLHHHLNHIINMNSLLSTIIALLRSLIKVLLRLLTRLTELQRVARSQDILAFQKALFASKKLAGYRQQHCTWQRPYEEDYGKELCAIKGIKGAQRQQEVTQCLRTLHNARFALKTIETFRKTPYDSNSPRHQQLLLQIWARLRPEVDLTSRKSNQWIELGFQADDPATDFRGSGVLGLINLHNWVGSQEGKRAFKTADTPSTDYFFASASIFMTMLAVELSREMKVNPRYWNEAENWKLPDWQAPFQRVFEAVWREFVVFWDRTEDKSMMQFNMNLLAFSVQMKSPSGTLRLNQALGMV